MNGQPHIRCERLSWETSRQGTLKAEAGAIVAYRLSRRILRVSQNDHLPSLRLSTTELAGPAVYRRLRKSTRKHYGQLCLHRNEGPFPLFRSSNSARTAPIPPHVQQDDYAGITAPQLQSIYLSYTRSDSTRSITLQYTFKYGHLSSILFSVPCSYLILHSSVTHPSVGSQ